MNPFEFFFESFQIFLGHLFKIDKFIPHASRCADEAIDLEIACKIDNHALIVSMSRGLIFSWV